ncbi:MAG: transposase [Elusimicrobiota bacterium]|nr:transposase [Elusimicrobiota bacterium]
MARQIRIEFEGGVYHITTRGNERKNIFLCPDDRRHFLTVLNKSAIRYGIIIYAYSLMDNHYHMVIETPLGNLVKFMHTLNSVYTGYFNRIHKRVGHLFQGRYKSIIVDKDSYLLAVVRYTHLNPVKAGIISKPEEYEWSSYGEYIGTQQNCLISTDFILSQFDENKTGAVEYFKKFHYDAMNKEDSLFAKTVSGLFLGSEKFIEKMKGQINSSSLTREIMGKRGLGDLYKRKYIMDLITRHYKVDEKELTEKGSKLQDAQKAAVYLLRKYTGMKVKEVSKYSGGRDYTYIPKIISCIENPKDKDTELSQSIKILEEKMKKADFFSAFKT